MNILVDATLPDIRENFKIPFFKVQTWQTIDELKAKIVQCEGLVCRATLKVDEALLKKTPIQYIATATSGIDHIDTDYLQSRNIRWFDAKGANASSVADYVISTLAYLRLNKLIKGQSVGIIGFGEVGTRVYNRIKSLGYKCYIYDPLTQNKTKDLVEKITELARCDLITIHASYHDREQCPSKNLIDHQFLKHMSSGSIIINAARGGIVNEKDLLHHIPRLKYCTDVFLNEPNINPEVIALSTISTPHIAGHSIEAKKRAMLVIKNKILTHIGCKKNTESLKLDIKRTIPMNDCWEKTVLSFYNPLIETQVMKSKRFDSSQYKDLRKNHNKRHEFNVYSDIRLTPVEKILLGMDE
tara:strand:+ start:436 stop:1503 length:1068 start_codon:yes stop_codon:yes gene_type:complete